MPVDLAEWSPPCRPQARFSAQDSRRFTQSTLCLAEKVIVPVRVYRHLPILAADADTPLLHEICGFWRARGCVLPLLLTRHMELDASQLFRQVALRGGFWACTAAQVRLQQVRISAFTAA
jgi:hypothetical protein